MAAFLRVVLLVFCMAGLHACSSAPTTLPSAPTPSEGEASLVVITIRNDRGHVASHAGATLRGYDAARPYRAGPAAERTVRRLARDYDLQPVAAWPIEVLGVHCIVFRLPQGEAIDAAIAKLTSDARVESAQPLTTFTTQGTANDPYRPLQHNLDTLGVDVAHEFSRGAGVRVAVIDTGVDIAHSDLDSANISSRNFVDADEARYRGDRHGTQIVGVIAARADNARGIVGVAPEVAIYAFKACWHDGAGLPARCNTFTLAQALAAAIDANVHAINLSLAGPRDPLLHRLLEKALERRIVIVAAMPHDPARGAFPAELPEVLAVQAAEFARPIDRVVLAPGRDVPTLVPHDAYDFASGSSIAAAEASGVVALLLARHPRLEVAQIRQILLASSVDALAAGTIDACRALALADGRDRCTSPSGALATADR